MAFWPFNRRRKRSERLQEKDASTSATQETTRDFPVQDQGFEEKLSTFKRRKNDPAKSENEVPKPRVIHSTNNTFQSSNPQPQPLVQAEGPQLINNVAASNESQGTSSNPLGQLYNLEEPPNVFDKPTDSLTSLQPENFTSMPLKEVPTLKSKRSSQTSDTLRKRSSKKLAKDREKEIKAMSSPIPIPRRPSSYSSGILARDTKRIPGGLNRPTSEVSLPLPESLRSSMSGDSEWQQSYKISALDALSPRPTIKYLDSPRNSGVRERSSRASTRKDKGPAIPEEPINAKARMEELADDLDAKGLRELMERDKRRRERKKRSDHEKLQKKLQRRLDAQKNEDQKAAPPVQEGLGVDLGEESREPALAVTPASPPSWLKDPSKEHLPPPDPFQDPMSESRLDLRTSSEQNSVREDAIIETAKAIRLSQASMSPPISPALRKEPLGPSSLSNLAVSAEDIPQISETPEPDYLQPPDIRRDSESSSRQGSSSWTSFFKRGGTKRKVSAEKDTAAPSEFSNTSRESFARHNKPMPPVVQRSFRRGSTPQRTQSKFREDLPELPMSPPRSRVQSPEIIRTMSPYIDDHNKLENLNNELRVNTPIEDIHPAFRDQISMSRQQSMRSASPDVASSHLLSQSLASIDSEGSWLSGRHPKRSSIPISSFRESQGSISQLEASEEVEEPDFSRREPTGNIRGPGGLSTQLRNLGGSSSDSKGSAVENATDEALKYDTVRGHRPNIIQRGPMVKSREGLLDEFTGTEEESPVSPISMDSPDSPTGGESSIQRATSVNYGQRGHVRQLSAGSARLLDIRASYSGENKRSSVGSDRFRNPLATPSTPEPEDPKSE
jgi:hypothetical protein